MANMPDAKEYTFHAHPKERWNYIKERLQLRTTRNCYNYNNILDYGTQTFQTNPDAHTFNLLVTKAIDLQTVNPDFVFMVSQLDDRNVDEEKVIDEMQGDAKQYVLDSRMREKLRDTLSNAVAYGDGYGFCANGIMEFLRHNEVDWLGDCWEDAIAVRVVRHIHEAAKPQFVEPLDYDKDTKCARVYEIWDNDRRQTYCTDENGALLTRTESASGNKINAKVLPYDKGLVRAPFERMAFGANPEEKYNYGLIYPWLPISDEIAWLQMQHNIKVLGQIYKPNLIDRKLAGVLESAQVREMNGIFYCPVSTNLFEGSQAIIEIPVEPLTQEYYSYLNDRIDEMRRVSHVSELEQSQPLSGRKTATEIQAIQAATTTWMEQQRNIVSEFMAKMWKYWADQWVKVNSTLLEARPQVLVNISMVDYSSPAGKQMKAQLLMEFGLNPQSPLYPFLPKGPIVKQIAELLNINDVIPAIREKAEDALALIGALAEEEQAKVIQTIVKMVSEQMQSQGGQPAPEQGGPPMPEPPIQPGSEPVTPVGPQ